MTGRLAKLVLIVFFVTAFTTRASAASFPVIVDLSPLGNINLVARTLNATIVDSIPGTNTWLLNIPLTVPSLGTLQTLPLLGIASAEFNFGVALPAYVNVGVLNISGNNAADWY